MTGHLEKDAWRPTPGVQIQPGKALWASIGTRVNGRAVRKGDLRTVDGAKQGSLPLCYLKSSPGLDVCCFNDVAISCSLWARVLHCCSRGYLTRRPRCGFPGSRARNNGYQEQSNVVTGRGRHRVHGTGRGGTRGSLRSALPKTTAHGLAPLAGVAHGFWRDRRSCDLSRMLPDLATATNSPGPGRLYRDILALLANLCAQDATREMGVCSQPGLGRSLCCNAARMVSFGRRRALLAWTVEA